MAYVRAATACAFSASAGQFAGISFATTPYRYVSRLSTLMTTRAFPARSTSSEPRSSPPS